MQKINILDFEIANLIAAGEVVERPSSVLKELLENSIDSGATEIVAEIKRGGVSLIRVSDNGCGIDKDDLPVSIKRHATSKIRDKADLEEIMTLGFRGEALAAISAVSNLTIITKTKESDTGHMLVAEAGKVVDLSPVGCADGTTVVVSDLFYNVPARRKFLKKDATEAMNVTALIEKVALSRPDISIQLLIDGQEKFKTPGNGKVLDTISSLFGRDFASKLIPISGKDGGIEVDGYVGRSDNVKKNRNLMNVFINGRYVKSLTAQAAIEKAYTSYIAPECFPTCVLFIKMNPALVDVNVHPAKLEVKFADERVVFEVIYYTIRRALEKAEYRPEMSLGDQKPKPNPLSAFVPIGEDTKGKQISIPDIPAYIKQTPTERTSSVKGGGTVTERTSFGLDSTFPVSDRGQGSYGGGNFSRTQARDGSFGASVRSGSYTIDRTGEGSSYPTAQNGGIGGNSTSRNSGEGAYSSARGEGDISSTMTPRDSLELMRMYQNTEAANSGITPTISTLPRAEAEKSVETDALVTDYKFIGEAFDCYVMIEYENALLVIDKHAAHERVIFEELKKRVSESGKVESQPLLIPIDISLDPEGLSAATEYKDELLNVGFDYIIDGKKCSLTAIPFDISSADAETLFVKMLDEIVLGLGTPDLSNTDRREKALYQIACKAAIKGGRVYDRAVLDWLIGKLLTIPDITVCPHGRPVAFRLTKTELDRQFDRIK